MSQSTIKNWEQRAWFASTSTTQTTATWAVRIDKKEEFPPNFAGESIFTSAPYRVYLPEDPREEITRPESAICLSPSGIDVLEILAVKITVLHFDFDKVLWIEEGSVLLHGWLAFRDSEKSYRVFFNDTNHSYFIPIIHSLRIKAFSLDVPEILELAKTPHGILALEKRDFGLMNMCREAVTDDESFIQLYFQESLDNRGPFAVVIAKNEVVFCRHIITDEGPAKIRGVSNHYVLLPSREAFSLIHRETRDVLSLPLMPEGTGGFFSFYRTGAEIDQFMLKLREILTILG